MRLILIALLLWSSTASAEVYKCVVKGKTEYSDRACDAAAKPAALPPLNTIAPKPGDDLAKRYDERLSREKKARDQGDEAFLKAHAENAARDKRVRAAIADRRVIKGMRVSEVESALGPPAEKRPDDSWVYRREGQKITVRFDDGEVSSVSTSSEKKTK